MFRTRLFLVSLLVVLVFTLAAPQSGLAAAGVGERTSSAPINTSIPYGLLSCMPIVTVYIYPSRGDPSTYETIWFNAFVKVDSPCGQPYTMPTTGTWDFGHGAKLHGSSVYFSYSEEGIYTVNFLDDLSDPWGRGLTASTTVVVRTHDVAVSDMKVHKNMHTGQTRPITVDVVSNRYDEQVQVQLFKSLNGGAWMPVSTSAQQSVPVGLTKHPVSFTFDYPVAPEDALAGTIAFKATAVIVGHYESLPADNTLLSEPVEVKK